MGALLSKKSSLTDILFTLEEKIEKTKVSLVKLKSSHSSTLFTFYLYSSLILPVLFTYSYYREKHVSLVLIIYFIVLFLLKILISFFFNIQIRRKEKLLEILKKTQRKNIDELKKQRLYIETKEIVDKYENKKIEVIEVENKKKLFDKVADLVLGEDPTKMYALICENCHAHNGLRHPSDYDLIKYECYSCKFINDKGLKKKKSKDDLIDSLIK
ncbi:hypothetical protein GVAV_002906 [Gurleya vavrai]